nr:hypothetical protein Iba_chr05cCG1160 [Ipomoea batatas]GMC96681.1 hypothetical protein Iba_chr05dCG0240 [Ipomoea batatas]
MCCRHVISRQILLHKLTLHSPSDCSEFKCPLNLLYSSQFARCLDIIDACSMIMLLASTSCASSSSSLSDTSVVTSAPFCASWS